MMLNKNLTVTFETGRHINSDDKWTSWGNNKLLPFENAVTAAEKTKVELAQFESIVVFLRRHVLPSKAAILKGLPPRVSKLEATSPISWRMSVSGLLTTFLGSTMLPLSEWLSRTTRPYTLTDWQTNRVAYRVTCTQLKSLRESISYWQTCPIWRSSHPQFQIES